MTRLTSDELRETQLRTLDHVAQFCREHGLRYQLAYGSLLGAARHQGYIPWDDDIDLMMPREDYRKFVRLHGAAATGFALGSPLLDHGWPLPYTKVWDVRTRVYEDTHLTLEAGVGVDVFPLDSVRPNGIRRFVAFTMARLVQLVHVLLAVRPRPDHAILKRLSLRVARPLLRLMAEQRLARVHNRLARARWWGCGHVGVFVGSFPWAVPQDQLADGSVLPFEGRQMPVPKDWGDVLTTLYGDYMTLPPAEAQVTHHVVTAVWATVHG